MTLTDSSVVMIILRTLPPVSADLFQEALLCPNPRGLLKGILVTGGAKALSGFEISDLGIFFRLEFFW